MLARELLDRPDEFITVTFGENEYVIENIQRKFTCANIDDSVMYITLNIKDSTCEGIKR